VRKGAERIGIKVTVQDPILSPIRPEEFQYLPADDAEYERWVALKMIPQGTHIRDAFGKNSKAYKFTEAGANLCRKNSLRLGGSGKVFKACYAASEYDPSYCNF
jgi:hypothetical protein